MEKPKGEMQKLDDFFKGLDDLIGPASDFTEVPRRPHQNSMIQAADDFLERSANIGSLALFNISNG